MTATLNFNIGVLGHVDSGKTSLVKVTLKSDWFLVKLWSSKELMLMYSGCCCWSWMDVLSLLIELDLDPLELLDCCDLDLFLDCLVSGVSKGWNREGCWKCAFLKCIYRRLKVLRDRWVKSIEVFFPATRGNREGDSVNLSFGNLVNLA